MQKEEISIIIESLQKDCKTIKLYDIEELSKTNILEILNFLERNRIIRFSAKKVFLEDGRLFSEVEFLLNSEEIIESLF